LGVLGPLIRPKFRWVFTPPLNFSFHWGTGFFPLIFFFGGKETPGFSSSFGGWGLFHTPLFRGVLRGGFLILPPPRLGGPPHGFLTPVLTSARGVIYPFWGLPPPYLFLRAFWATLLRRLVVYPLCLGVPPRGGSFKGGRPFI